MQPSLATTLIKLPAVLERAVHWRAGLADGAWRKSRTRPHTEPTSKSQSVEAICLCAGLHRSATFARLADLRIGCYKRGSGLSELNTLTANAWRLFRPRSTRESIANLISLAAQSDGKFWVADNSPIAPRFRSCEWFGTFRRHAL
jgi:hypothetical protein